MIDSFSNINNKLNSKIYFNHNIGKLTWFRTGGAAKMFAVVENIKELQIILNELNIDNFYLKGSYGASS